jgi:hypothetical protein
MLFRFKVLIYSRDEMGGISYLFFGFEYGDLYVPNDGLLDLSTVEEV